MELIFSWEESDKKCKEEKEEGGGKRRRKRENGEDTKITIVIEISKVVDNLEVKQANELFLMEKILLKREECREDITYLSAGSDF